MNKKTILLVLTVAALSALPLPILKEYTVTKNSWLIISSGLLYLMIIFIYINILGDFELIVIYPILKIISDIIVISFGIFLFKEELNIKKTIGIFFGFLSIFLLASK